MSVTVYGISNCDTVRKARRWLDRAGVAYSFHDLRADGLAADTLDRWLDRCGWEELLNRRSTSWKNLPESARQGLNRGRAKELMLATPTLVKRPVTDTGERLLVGFSPELFEMAFGR